MTDSPDQTLALARTLTASGLLREATEVGGDLRAHHAGAENGHLANRESIHG